MDKITITRVQSNTTDDYIVIEIRNTNHKKIYIGEMTIEDFGRCVTGMAAMDIKPMLKAGE